MSSAKKSQKPSADTPTPKKSSESDFAGIGDEMLSRTRSINSPGAEVMAFVAGQVEIAGELTVESPHDSIVAQNFRSKAMTAIARLKDQRLGITRPMDEAKRLIMDLFQKPIDALQQCVQQADRQILAFDNAQRAAAREAQRIADEKSEKERQRLAKLSEKAEARGDMAKADQYADQAAMAVAPVVEVESPQAKGAHFTETWSWELIDQRKMNETFKQPDEAKIGKQVRALHKDAEEVIGKGSVRIFSNRGLATRRQS